MYLEDNKWKNWHTRCSDAAIKNNKKEDTKICTISVSKFERFGEWITEFPTPEDSDYNIELWQSFGHENHSTCDRNWCPFKCEK